MREFNHFNQNLINLFDVPNASYYTTEVVYTI